MKKIARIALIALATSAAQYSQAATSSFNTVAGTSFEEYFAVTPTTTNKLFLTVSGMTAQFGSLSFEILGGPTPVTKTLNGLFSVAFNDYLNNSYSLAANTPYTLKISGVTLASPVGGSGIVNINYANGTVTPVPEPESYAMLLAGLGLVGTIARRRSKKQAV